MGIVIYDKSMSLDGFIAAENMRPEAGLGDGRLSGFQRGHLRRAVGGIKSLSLDDDRLLLDCYVAHRMGCHARDDYRAKPELDGSLPTHTRNDTLQAENLNRG